MEGVGAVHTPQLTREMTMSANAGKNSGWYLGLGLVAMLVLKGCSAGASKSDKEEKGPWFPSDCPVCEDGWKECLYCRNGWVTSLNSDGYKCEICKGRGRTLCIPCGGSGRR